MKTTLLFSLTSAALWLACGPPPSMEDELELGEEVIASDDHELAGRVREGSAAPSIFDRNWCKGPRMTQAEALARFASGATSFVLGKWSSAARKRTCTELTGCGPWTEGGDVLFVHRDGGGRAVKIKEGKLALRVASNRHVELIGNMGAPNEQFRATLAVADSNAWLSHHSLVVGNRRVTQLSGAITNDCMALRAAGETWHRPSYQQVEVVLHANY